MKLRNYKYNIVIIIEIIKVVIIIILIFLIKDLYKRFCSDIELTINACVIKLKIINNYNYICAMIILAFLN